MNYYNEWDKYAAQWLRNLIAEKLIPAGDVDERDIRKVQGADLKGYVQCHFFVGIGGWPLALQLAGWPHDKPVWTGSCPCQPFSVAGKRMGRSDKRHLWPDFLRLIAARRPSVCFGEQVSGEDGLEWLAGVRADLAACGFEVGAADLCAAGVGAPHIRQRLYWVADAADSDRRSGAPRQNGKAAGDGCGVEHATCEQVGISGRPRKSRSAGRWLGDPSQPGLEGRDLEGNGACKRSSWTPSVAIQCIDGKSRRVESGTFPLAHGIPGRVGKLRAYGNAIVPEVAAEFVRAYMEARAQ